MSPISKILCTLITSSLSLYAAESELITWETTAKSLDKYCSECHSDDLPDADLDITSIDQRADLEANPEKWTRVLQALRTHYMPHPDGRNLPPQRRDELIQKISGELIQQAGKYDSISAQFRRLNRVEFSNTINDLLLIQGDWTKSLPADDAGYGFDNIAAALSISPLLIERYFSTAAEAAQLAVPRKMEPKVWDISGATFHGGNSGKNVRNIHAAGGKHSAKHTLFFPGKGSYKLTFKLSAQQAGPENAFAELRLGHELIGREEVTAAEGETPNTILKNIQIDTPGEHRLEVRLWKDYRKKTETGEDDRNLLLHGVEIEGPFQTAQDLRSPFLDRHFGSHPEKLSTQGLRDGIHRLTSRAFRRAVLPEEIEDLWAVFVTNSAYFSNDRNVHNGICAIIDAVLTSPSFLFRLEDPAQADDFGLATWLSYFLWSSMPDDQLFQLAFENELRNNLDAEIERMLKDPKATALAENFAGQWWRLRDLEFHRPDRSLYENASPELLVAMKEETERMFVHILQEDRPLQEFLTADYTFINERLAKHYGIPKVKGKQFRKVSLADTPRRGIWSQAGILTVTSYPNYTSPVLRGQWILENIVGLAPPPPPDNIPSLPGTEGKPEPSDLRASLALHRDNPDCASCHNIMDPFGLALEHYDAVGGLRDLEERKKITNEELFDGTEITGPADLATYFAETRSDDFIKNLAHKLAIYASGRGLDWRDEAAIQRIAEQTGDAGYTFSAMITAVANEFAPLREVASLKSRSTNRL
ncbi:MAG: DUF1592 domain-containing protein [Lentimonas sp.]